MLSFLLAAQVAAATPAADQHAADVAATEQAIRAHLVATGMSPTGADATLAVQRQARAEHVRLVDRLVAANRALYQAAATNPIDVAAVERAMVAQDAAQAALLQARTALRIAQLRALPVADRRIALRDLTPRSPGALLPVAPPAPPPPPPPPAR